MISNLSPADVDFSAVLLPAALTQDADPIFYQATSTGTQQATASAQGYTCGTTVDTNRPYPLDLASYTC